MKNKIKIKSKKTFFRKRNIFITSFLTASVSITPTIVLSTQLSREVSYNGMTFKSSEKLIDYVKNNSTKKIYTEDDNAQWEFKLNGQSFRFNSPREMQEKLSSYINVEERITSLSEDQLASYVSSSATGNIFSDDFWNVTQIGSDVAKASSTKVYQAANDKIVQSEDDAYKSHYYESSAYSFNGMYFQSKEDLAKYLKNDYLLSNNKITDQKIIIKAPNGSTSAPINLSDTKALEFIKSFISNNYSDVINYVGSNGEDLTLTKENLNSNLNAITLEDLDYIHINSNEGKSRYIVDNSVEDTNDLIGPYFYNGNLDVGSFMNKSMWQKTTDVKNKVWQEGKVNSFIGAFFTSIINDDNMLNLEEAKDNSKSTPTIFRTLLASDSSNEVSYDEQYLSNLKTASESVYNDVMSSLNSLLKGKKANTFYKIPVMYSLIIQKLISVNAEKEIINETINYFSKICDYLQNSLETIILDQSLLVNSKNEKFNLKELFNIGNKEFNVNTNVEYFMNKLKEWPKLVTAMIVYIEALNNLSSLGGLIPFSGNDNKFLFDFSVISQDEYYLNEDKFEKIYNTYSKNNYSDFVKEFVNNSQLSSISSIKNEDESEWENKLNDVLTYGNIPLGTLLKTVIVKNTIQYNISKNALISEIEELKKTGMVVEGGMLDQLGKALGPFIKGTNSDQVDVYQAYLAVLADMRRGGDTLTSESKVSNVTTLLKNINYFASTVLSSAIMVKDVVSTLFDKAYRIFWDGSSIVNSQGLASRVFTPIRSSLRKSYNKIKGSLGRLNSISSKNSYTVNASTFKPSLVAGDKYFWKNEMSLFDKAAPFINSAFLLMQAGLFAYDLFSQSSSTVYYTYTTADGTQFIWDGGELVSKYLGFVTEETATIDDMKLVQPIQFTLGQVEEYYYYDGVKYFDKNDLKNVQLNYIFSKDYKNENKHFTKKYSFDTYAAGSVKNLYNSLDELISGVLSSLGIKLSSDKSKIDSYSLNNTSPYLVASQYSFSTGLLTNHDGAVEVIAKNIVDNIRATKIVKLPTIKDGVVETTQAKSEIVIPGKVWTSNGIVDNSSKASEYLVDNSANDVSSQITDWSKVSASNFKVADQKQAEKQASEKIYESFKSKFKLNSKDVSNLDLTNNLINKNNKYSEVNSNPRKINVYSVNIPGQKVLYFLDQGKAEYYASLFTNATKTNTNTYTSYSFDGMYFKTEKDLRNWAYSLRG